MLASIRAMPLDVDRPVRSLSSQSCAPVLACRATYLWPCSCLEREREKVKEDDMKIRAVVGSRPFVPGLRSCGPQEVLSAVTKSQNKTPKAHNPSFLEIIVG
jgi:hypothetical protein